MQSQFIDMESKFMIVFDVYFIFVFVCTAIHHLTKVDWMANQ